MSADNVGWQPSGRMFDGLLELVFQGNSATSWLWSTSASLANWICAAGYHYVSKFSNQRCNYLRQITALQSECCCAVLYASRLILHKAVFSPDISTISYPYLLHDGIHCAYWNATNALKRFRAIDQLNNFSPYRFCEYGKWWCLSTKLVQFLWVILRFDFRLIFARFQKESTYRVCSWEVSRLTGSSFSSYRKTSL